MINIYDGSMHGMTAIAGGSIVNVLKSILTSYIGKEQPDAVSENILIFNSGYHINEDAFYSLHLDDKIINVTCKNYEGKNNVLVNEDIDLSLYENIYLSLRKPSGWSYSLNSNNYHVFENKNGASFSTDNGNRWLGSKNGVSTTWQQGRIINGSDYIVLANDDMFIIGCYDASLGMVYTFYMSDERYVFVTEHANSGGISAGRGYVIDGVAYINAPVTVLGLGSQYSLIESNDDVAYISDVYLKAINLHKINYLKQILNGIDNLKVGYSSRYRTKEIKGGKLIVLLMHKSEYRSIPFFMSNDND